MHFVIKLWSSVNIIRFRIIHTFDNNKWMKIKPSSMILTSKVMFLVCDKNIINYHFKNKWFPFLQHVFL